MYLNFDDSQKTLINYKKALQLLMPTHYYKELAKCYRILGKLTNELS